MAEREGGSFRTWTASASATYSLNFFIVQARFLESLFLQEGRHCIAVYCSPTFKSENTQKHPCLHATLKMNTQGTERQRISLALLYGIGIPYVGFTDAPSVLRTSSILGVSGTFRTASTGSTSSTEGLNTASTGNMSSTEGHNTASTGSMSSKRAASTGVSAVVSNPEILGSIEYPQYRTPKYCAYSQYILLKYCRYS